MEEKCQLNGNNLYIEGMLQTSKYIIMQERYHNIIDYTVYR